MKKIAHWRWLVLLSFSLLLGCAAGTQYYPNAHEKNLTVNLKLTEKGKALTTISVHAGVNEMAGDCSSQYLGIVKLSDGANKIGLEPGKTSAVVILISRRGYLERDMDFKRETLITPVAGKQYEIAVNYADGMFDFRFYEITKSGKKELPIVPASACKPTK